MRTRRHPGLVLPLAALLLAGCDLSSGLPLPDLGGEDTAGGDDDVAPDVAVDALDDVVPDAIEVDDAVEVFEDVDSGDTVDATDLADTSDGDGDDGSDTSDTIEPPPPEGPARYAADRTHSPITPALAARLRALLEAVPGPDPRVFAKVGDSITVSNHFLHCFAGSDVDLGGRDALGATLAHFAAPVAGGTTSFDRTSEAAGVGWSTFSTLAGSPSPVERELAALDPRFAVVMYGTNDIQLDNLERYANDMLDLVDLLLAAGVVPILSTIPPRDDDAAADARVPHYNAVVRGIAQGRQVPLVDLHRELVVLPGHGLGGDDLHPSVYVAGGAHGCWLVPEALQHGYNVRNLLTLEALDRVRRHVLDGEAPPDPPHAPLPGEGSAAAPFEIDALPFTAVVDTATRTEHMIDAYGCAPGVNESGPELHYVLHLDAPRRVRASVHDRGEVDIDLHVLDASGDPATGCVARDHRSLVLDLAAGTWTFVLDSYVDAGGTVRSGEALFVVIAD